VVDLKHLFADPRLRADIKRIRDLSRNTAHQARDSSDGLLRVRKQHATHLSEARVDELVARYEAGATVPVLIEEFRIHRSTVLNHLKRRGVHTRVKRRVLTDQQVAEAAKQYRAGDSLATIGKRYGVVAGTVRRELIKIGVEMRPKGFQP
jgi:hypothetical protein